MTAKEKLKLDHPDWDDEYIAAVIWHDCPDEHGYLECPENCSNGFNCGDACWDREIPNIVMEGGFWWEVKKTHEETD
jgi:hypothetical protein